MATYKLTKPAKEHLLIDGKDVVQKMQWEQMQEEMRKIMEEPATRFLRYGDRDMEVMNRVGLREKAEALALVFMDMHEADVKKQLGKEKIKLSYVTDVMYKLLTNRHPLTSKDILTNKATILRVIGLIEQECIKWRKIALLNKRLKNPTNVVPMAQRFKKGEAKLATTKSKKKVDLSKLVSKVQGNYN